MTTDEDDDRPRRVKARYAGFCTECHAAIEPGDSVVYEPARGASRAKVYCEDWGEQLLDN